MTEDERSLRELLRNTPPEERAAVLDRVCEDRPELRRRLEPLLSTLRDVPRIEGAAPPAPPAAAAADPAGTTRDDARTVALSPSPSPSPADGSDSGSGAAPRGDSERAEARGGALIAGRYRLAGLIGEGGMGTVWMAEQTAPVRRRVALKLIRAEREGSIVVLARFETERRAIAMMDHPCIAKLLDAGATDRGAPWFAMEFVEGDTLVRHCDARNASIPERLELFARVCAAVQHAHQKGVIHRDLKPSNILVTTVDGAATPKVIDFGLAKAAGGPGPGAPGSGWNEWGSTTVAGGVMGTPLYMAPEQAAATGVSADVDTRADVHALGALLYELLTGSTPLDRRLVATSSVEEVLRLIREEDPPPPSRRAAAATAETAARRGLDPRRLAKRLRGDLDCIVMKALEKDRDRRYAAALELGRDLERHLRGEPVSAAPPTAAYRARKFCRRHRGRVIAAALSLAALVLGLAGAVAGLLEARRQAAAANRAARIADLEKTRARESEAEARAARAEAERHLAYAMRGNEILGAVFADLNPERIEQSGLPLPEALRENLARAVAELDAAAIGDPMVVARARGNLGRSLLGLGDAERAVAVLRSAFEGVRRELGPDAPETLNAMINLASALRRAGRAGEAGSLFEEAWNRSRAALDPEAPQTLAALRGLGVLRAAQGDLRTGLPMLERALAGWRAAVGDDDLQTLEATRDLAEGYRQAGRSGEAVELFETVRDRCLERFGPDHPTTLNVAADLAVALGESGRADLALPLLEGVLERRRAVFGPDHPATLAALATLAAGRHATGRFDLAIPLFEEALARTRRRLGAEHPDTLPILNNLAASLMAADRPDEAVAIFGELVARTREALGPTHPGAMHTLHNLGATLAMAGRPAEARGVLEEVWKLRRETLGPAHRDALKTAVNLARLLRDSADPAAALSVLDEALAAGGDAPRLEIAELHVERGAALARAGRPDEAAEALRLGYERLSALGDPAIGPGAADVLELMAVAAENLAELAEAAGRPEEAVLWRAVAEARRQPRPRPPGARGRRGRPRRSGI